MDNIKRQKLEAAGWCVGDASDFLNLSPEENAIIEMKLALSKKVREKRVLAEISQDALAARMHSSQSRVAKMEAGDPSVSMDLLVKALLYTGASKEDVAQALTEPAFI